MDDLDSHLSTKAYHLFGGTRVLPPKRACGSKNGFNSVFVFDGKIVETYPLRCPRCIELRSEAEKEKK